jgi:NAD+ synthase
MDSIDVKRTKDTLVGFLKTSFENAGFSRAVIGLSGGVDSATSAALAVQALGATDVFPLILPYDSLNPAGAADARKVANWLDIPKENWTEIDIKPIVDQVAAADPKMDQVRRGNAMARVRMTLIYDQAKKRQALVVGTENRTEHLLGYFTRFGDEASDIEPLRNLYKTQVYELARELGVPEEILAKSPTAGLWEGQTDEGEFGFTYREADEILSRHVDKKETVGEIVNAGLGRKTVEAVIARMRTNEFKHRVPLVFGRDEGIK